MNDKELARLAESVGKTLLSRKRRLVTAESCTGGWIAKLITDIPGSSEWFDRGFVTYSNQSKREMLQVSGHSLEQEGAVSRVVVEQMASGALANSAADTAVAVSGVAGPGGGTRDKPVGTVWLAWCSRDSEPRSLCAHFSGDRDAVRRQTVIAALRGLED